MKKIVFSVLVLGLLIGACTPAAQPVAPTPISDADLQATANVAAQQTLAAIPTIVTPTQPPTDTPVVVTATNTEPPVTPTETQNPDLLTLTATLGTGTIPATTDPNALPTMTPPPPSATANVLTPVATDVAMQYGTVPNDYPRGWITVVNKADDETYISLQIVLDNGQSWIDEYPVKKRKSLEVVEPAGRYHYVVWVGATKMTGDFGLGYHHTVQIVIRNTSVEIIAK
jgi:hypothetical protein